MFDITEYMSDENELFLFKNETKYLHLFKSFNLNKNIGG